MSRRLFTYQLAKLLTRALLHLFQDLRLRLTSLVLTNPEIRFECALSSRIVSRIFDAISQSLEEVLLFPSLLLYMSCSQFLSLVISTPAPSTKVNALGFSILTMILNKA